MLNDDAAHYNLTSEVLINPIGMASLVMETDPTGNFSGSSYSYATVSDWDKFGKSYL